MRLDPDPNEEMKLDPKLQSVGSRIQHWCRYPLANKLPNPFIRSKSRYEVGSRSKTRKEVGSGITIGWINIGLGTPWPANYQIHSLETRFLLQLIRGPILGREY